MFVQGMHTLKMLHMFYIGSAAITSVGRSIYMLPRLNFVIFAVYGATSWSDDRGEGVDMSELTR